MDQPISIKIMSSFYCWVFNNLCQHILEVVIWPLKIFLDTGRIEIFELKKIFITFFAFFRNNYFAI